MSESHDVPKPGAGDAAYAGAKALVGSIPIVGAAASELLGLIVAPPLERRRNEWLESVGRRLRELEARGLDLEKLRDSEAFLDLVAQATQAAIRTGVEEKRKALRNAVLNATQPNPPDAALQQVFVGLVDSFTEWHLRLLKLFDDPVDVMEALGKPFPNLMAGSLSSVLEAAYPELRDRRSFYDLVWRALNSSGLTNTDSLHTSMTGNGMKARRTTELGQQFLRFIEEA